MSSVRAFHVDPALGDDAKGDGSFRRPWRTEETAHDKLREARPYVLLRGSRLIAAVQSDGKRLDVQQFTITQRHELGFLWSGGAAVESVVREPPDRDDPLDDRLADFLYGLLRDHLPAGVVEVLARDAEQSRGPIVFSNEHLGRYAKELADRLRGPEGDSE